MAEGNTTSTKNQNHQTTVYQENQTEKIMKTTATVRKKEVKEARKADLAASFVEVFSGDNEQAKIQYAKDALSLVKFERGKTLVEIFRSPSIECDSLICDGAIALVKKSQFPGNNRNKCYSVTDQKSGQMFLETKDQKTGKVFSACAIASGANLQNMAVCGFDASNPALMTAFKSFMLKFRSSDIKKFVDAI
jgi:hypothetical protein